MFQIRVARNSPGTPNKRQLSGREFNERVAVMPMRLIALDGGPDIILSTNAPLTMGRDPQCDARLDSLRVSRFHCCVAQVEDGVQVSDLGSTNGTRINGRWVRSGRLREGDELTVAHLRFRVEGGGESLAMPHTQQQAE
jgi:pSer/pThr/pTyr-binding forkhead associated (FHA) protein